MKTNSPVPRLSPFVGRFELNRLVAALFAVVILISGSHSAQSASALPPEFMAYQGFLVDANGDPLAPTTPLNYPVIFRVYTASQGGELLWSEQQIVTVDKGSFGVMLGQGTDYASEQRGPLSRVLGGEKASELFIGVTVTIEGVTQEILPRLRLMTSPYAFLATRASSLVKPDGSQIVTHDGSKLVVVSDVTVVGTVTGTVAGNGSGLTGFTSSQVPNLNASKITSGTLNNSRLNSDLGSRAFSSITLTGDMFLDNDTRFRAKNAAGIYEYFLWPRYSDNVTYFNFGSGGFNLRNNSSTTRLFIQNGGNVGIGTTSPTSRLSLGGGNVTEKFALWDGGSAGNTMGLGVGAGQFRLHLNPAANRFSFLDAPTGNALVEIYDSGNLQVRGPNAQLNVNHGGFSDATVTLKKRSSDLWTLVLADGNALKSGTSTWAVFSDARLKQNIGAYNYGLAEIAKLNTVQYRYRDNKALNLSAKKQHYGFVAQDVQALMPEAVSTFNGTNLVLNTELIYLAGINAIKELNQKAVDLEAENVSLKKQLSDLQRGNVSIQNRVAALERLLSRKGTKVTP